MFEDRSLEYTYHVRDVAPTTLILGNIGIANLDKYISIIDKKIEELKLDGTYIHLNPAQEIFQKEGDINWSGCVDTLKKFCSIAKYPVIIKEVGCGISKECAELLIDCGINIIDVAGRGGTNWIKVEEFRGDEIPNEFKAWGIPTTCSLLELGNLNVKLISSGGVRTGFDIAKSVVLGADMCGIALPFLRIYNKSGKKGIIKYINKLEQDLKTAMFLVGAKNIRELKKCRYVLRGYTKEWLNFI